MEWPIYNDFLQGVPINMGIKWRLLYRICSIHNCVVSQLKHSSPKTISLGISNLFLMHFITFINIIQVVSKFPCFGDTLYKPMSRTKDKWDILVFKINFLFYFDFSNLRILHFILTKVCSIFVIHYNKLLNTVKPRQFVI